MLGCSSALSALSIVILEKFKKAIVRGNKFGALLTDILKDFGCIGHTLLMGELYG